MLKKLILKLLEKTNGWKSILGYLILKITGWIALYYPEAPAQEIAIVLEWIGEILLGIGLAHKAAKETGLLAAAPKKKA